MNIRRGQRETHNSNNNVHAELDDEDDENEDDDAQTVTDTTASASDMISTSKLTKAETRAQKKAAKAAKSQSKAFKNQKKHTISVRTEDVDFVAAVLHGDSAAATQAATHPLASDKTIEEVIQRNMGFVANIAYHKKQLMASIAQRRRSERERRKSSSVGAAGSKKRRFSDMTHLDDIDDDEETEHLLTAILAKLGIQARAGGADSVVGSASGKKGTPKIGSGGGVTATQGSIVASLKALVKEDLKKHENEQRETCIRAGGFWRYVGKPVFERMTKIAEGLDWKTGKKLKEREGEK